MSAKSNSVLLTAVTVLFLVQTGGSTGIKLSLAANYCASQDPLFREIYGQGNVLPTASLK